MVFSTPTHTNIVHALIPLTVVTQICVPHPNYPTTRVAVRLQSLGFQFSPARYHRIMQVFGIFGDESNEEDTRSAFRPWDSPDFNGQMSVLSWTVCLLIANPPLLILYHKSYFTNLTLIEAHV